MAGSVRYGPLSSFGRDGETREVRKPIVSRLPLRLGVVYDFRNPPDSGIPTSRLYAEILDQVAWLDTLGLDLVWFTEHHFVDNGYLPSWTPVEGTMAGGPNGIRTRVSALRGTS